MTPTNRRLLPERESRIACQECQDTPTFKCCGLDSWQDTAKYCPTHMRVHWDYAHVKSEVHMGVRITQATANRISRDGP